MFGPIDTMFLNLVLKQLAQIATKAESEFK